MHVRIFRAQQTDYVSYTFHQNSGIIFHRLADGLISGREWGKPCCTCWSLNREQVYLSPTLAWRNTMSRRQRVASTEYVSWPSEFCN